MCAVVAVLTCDVVIGKVAVVAPVGTTTFAPTCAEGLSLARFT
jgi:hypothetical protein